MDLFSGLNEAQVEAVKTIDGPLLILAGAGSGKTKTLTHRIAHLVLNHGVASDEILAVTFTNKAAKEMRQRLGELLKRPVNYFFMPWMGTFHGICVKMLRESGQAINIDPNFVIYDETDRRSLIKRATEELGLSTSQIKPKVVSTVISNAKNQMISATDFQAQAKGHNQTIYSDIYFKYETLRQHAKALDFDDLLNETVRLLKSSETIKKYWQQRFKFILVDEYQDTNFAQYQLVRLLAADNQNICVVGDDWQSIYSWRGADFTNILNFKKDYPQAKEIKLEQNYRSTGNILSSAQNVIEKNNTRSDKKIWTNLGDGDPVIVTPTYDETAEATEVVRIVRQLVANKSIKLSDIAVLYRTNAQSFALERALVQAKIPHKIIGGVPFFDRAIVKDALAYLKLIYQPYDQASFGRIVNVPARGIGKVSVEKFLQWQQQTKFSIVEALNSLDQADSLSAQVKKKLQVFTDIINQLIKIAATAPPANLLESVYDLTRLKISVDDGSEEGDSQVDHLATLLQEAQAYADLRSFLEDVALMSSSDESSEGSKLNLMTIHASKGLEFPAVIVVGMEEGIFPHSRVFEDPAGLEEERRLCYVAMTRAKRQLYLLYANCRYQFGERTYQLPSQFLVDSGLVDTDQPAVDLFDDGVDYEPFVNYLEVGDKVRSPQFGLGEVDSVDGLAVTVRFSDGRQRKLNTEFANLEKMN